MFEFRVFNGFTKDGHYLWIIVLYHMLRAWL